MITIGIDPGLSGSVAVLGEEGIIKIYDTPVAEIKSGKKTKRAYVESEMARILSNYNIDGAHAAIEGQHAFPGQGVSSMYKLGLGYGLWVGILAALKIPYTVISSTKWKKGMGLTGKEKAASCLRAQQLYPDAELFTERGRALDGRADALLIATYLKEIR